MPRQERISDRIEFVGKGNEQDNLYGNPSYKKVVFYDDFLGDVLEDAWCINIDNSCTGVIDPGVGGLVKLTTEATDNDKVEIAHELNWEAAKSCIMEARIMTDNIANVSICAGFNDAKNETAQKLAFSISNVTITNTTSDAVMFVMDADQAVANWYFCNDKNNTAAGTISDVAIADNEYNVLRVETDTDGNAWFHIDGELVGYKASAITNTDDLTPYVGFQNRADDISALYIDYIKCWQSRE